MARRREMQPTDRNNRRRSPCSVDKEALCNFFKIILDETIQQKKLHIPFKFVKRFGDELTDVADLIVPNGRVWKIGVSKAEDNIWFDDGWVEFAEHHSICNGHLLVFAYTGSCSFNVSIFDTTAYEIEYPCNDEEAPSSDENSPIENEIEMQDDIPSEMLNSKVSTRSDHSLKRKCSDASATRDSSETHNKTSRGTASKAIPNSEHLGTSKKRLKQEPLVGKIDIDANETRRKKLVKGKPEILEIEKPLFDEQKTSRMTLRSGKTDLSAECQDKETEIITSTRLNRIKATPRTERAICAAKAYMPKNPSFMVVLTAHQNSMYVPKRFVRYLKARNRKINLQVSDGRKWEVHLHGGPKRRDLGQGWSTFCSDNNLNEGDVCVFELVKDKDVLKVSIFNAI
ncbi:AP2/B3-like transcriptional factor family protein [Euphorbia peplus]|nr:AP2/B3-like transcriptional factor family protein [Euphorbia peplus]